MAAGDLIFRAFAVDNRPPAANRAAMVSRNDVMYLAFDSAAEEFGIFRDIVGDAYDDGEDIEVTIGWISATAVAGDVLWKVAIEVITPGTEDRDSDSFATAKSFPASTAHATSGVVVEAVVTMTQAEADNIAAGKEMRVKVSRDATAGGDTMNGDDAQFAYILIRQA